MIFKDETFFKTVRDFLTIYLPKQKCYSPNTVNSYRITLNLFIDYLVKENHIPMHKVSFSDLKRENVIDFLNWLQSKRNSSSSTRNQRLMALKSFAKYAGFTNVAHVAIHMDLGNVPIQKTPLKTVEFLSEDALKVLLLQPDTRSCIGLRNQFFMILMYDTAARCQEILDLKLKDFETESNYPFVYLTGKGGKTRTVPLMTKTINHLHNYLDKFHPTDTRKDNDYLFFTTIHGKKGQMSPDNAASFMKKYGEAAQLICAKIPDRVHPHQLRHTRAIHLYRGGMPLALLSEFLGHADSSTTQVYAYADTEMKRNAIQKACPTDETTFEKPIWENDDDMIRKLYGLV